MLGRKRIREKGKISFTKYFQKFSSGDSVALVRDLSISGISFPDRMQGRTGKIIGKRGRAYVIEVKDLDKKKQFAVKPIHLRRITEIK